MKRMILWIAIIGTVIGIALFAGKVRGIGGAIALLGGLFIFYSLLQRCIK